MTELQKLCDKVKWLGFLNVLYLMLALLNLFKLFILFYFFIVSIWKTLLETENQYYSFKIQ